MKILLVNKFLYQRGGAETYVLKLGDCLRQLGHEIQYFGMHDRQNTVGNTLHLETKHLDFHAAGAERFLYPARILYSREAKRKIKALVGHFQPDVVHLNNINYQLTPSVIDGAWEMGVPMVQTVHDAQMVCPSHMLLDWKERTPCERCVEGSKWNCAVHRCIHGSLVKSILGSVEGTLYQRLSCYSRVACFLCPSRFMQSLLERDRRLAGKTVVLPNFTEYHREQAREKEDYVLYFGRLAPEKDMEGLLAAFRLCPEIPFVIAGNGPLRGLMDSLPAHVRYVGFQTGSALRTLIARAQFSVYPSIWYENCPLSILESQSLGTPVLANRIGGIPELIREGQSGQLMDTFTPEHYAARIRALYRDREGLARMWAYCREQKPGLTGTDYCRRLLEIYRTAAGDLP